MCTFFKILKGIKMWTEKRVLRYNFKIGYEILKTFDEVGRIEMDY